MRQIEVFYNLHFYFPSLFFFLHHIFMDMLNALNWFPSFGIFCFLIYFILIFKWNKPLSWLVHHFSRNTGCFHLEIIPIGNINMNWKKMWKKQSLWTEAEFSKNYEEKIKKCNIFHSSDYLVIISDRCITQ